MAMPTIPQKLINIQKYLSAFAKKIKKKTKALYRLYKRKYLKPILDDHLRPLLNNYLKPLFDKHLKPYLIIVKDIYKEKYAPIIHSHPSVVILKAQMAKFPMNKTMRTMLIAVLILFGSIFTYKIFNHYMINKYMSSQAEPTISVSTIKAESSAWQDKLTSAATLRAIKGVSVTTELAGLVRNIYFTPGATVKQDDILIELNTATDIATLHALEASAALAKIVYERDKAQYAIKAISKAQLDADEADLKAKNDEVVAQSTTVAKKIIKAPFAGRLGINQVNPGQYLNVGDPVTTLQQLDPIYVDFFLPQQALAKVKLGQTVEVSIDTYPNKTFSGKITTINPIVDKDTRNVLVEATIHNDEDKLLPGMFGQATLDVGEPQTFLTLPQTAISYNPYGDIVYTIHQSDKKDKKGNPIEIAQQNFVKLGDTRGEQIAILSGIKDGDIVVTSGQLKLKNGSPVSINNNILPSNNPNPQVKNN